MSDGTPWQGWRRSAAIAVLCVVTVVVSAGVGWAVFALTAPHREVTGQAAAGTATSGSDSAASLLSAKPLTLDAAKVVYDNAIQARDGTDVTQFEASTCAQFIAADMKLRGLNSPDELLHAYGLAKNLVPVQFIDNAMVISASSDGDSDSGAMLVRASVTDNRFVPPQTNVRDIHYDVHYEEGVWKFCPGVDPV